jgi:hypothetical protein
MFNIILIVSLLFSLYFIMNQNNKRENFTSCSNKNKNINIDYSKVNKEIENFNTDRVFIPNPVENDPPKKIVFDYEDMRNIDKQFLLEQEKGANLATWYPNTWIEKINENGEPVYNSRENVLGKREDFIESKARFSYEFNIPRTIQMDGIADPADFINGQGRTIKEIYDNSFVDYKKLIPKKDMKEKEELRGASNLFFNQKIDWEYENEKPENGGQISDQLYAFDPQTNNIVANF